jgi:uncharacterized membrane protein YozB (DUF420 family)
MTNMQKARPAIIIVWVCGEVAWLLAFVLFLVPRATAGLPALVAFAMMGAGFIAIPFVSVLRGVDLEKRSDKQWLALALAPFAVGLAAFLLLPISRVLTAVVFVAIMGGSLASFYLKRA